jgi:hypothetical protein
MGGVRGLVVLCLLVTGCELVFGPAPGGPGAGDAASADADGDAPDADPDAMLGGFAPPVKITVAGVIPIDSFFTDPSLTGDAEWMAFVISSSVASNSADIFIAQATSSDGLEWDTPSMIPPSMSGRDETNPELADDGTLLYAAISTGGPASVQVWDPDNWGDVTATEASGLETAEDDRPGTPTPDLRHMVIERKIGTNPTQLVEYKRDEEAPWVEVAGTLALVNAIGSVTNPQLIAGGRVLVFAARVGGATLDLYYATRGDFGQSFGAPMKIEGVSTAQSDDADPWMSGDGRRLWFTRIGGSLPFADWGIYYTSRP